MVPNSDFFIMNHFLYTIEDSENFIDILIEM